MVATLNSASSLSERALQRRLKRHLRKRKQRFFAVCAPGLEPCLATELELLGVGEKVTFPGGIEFSGPFDSLYQANLKLRTASRVLLRIGDFLAQSYPMLFDKARKLPWELYLGFAPHYRVRVSAKESRLRHQKRLAATLERAISAALAPLGLHPTATADEGLEFHLRLFQDRCTLSLGTSGEHLHIRGYHQSKTPAPLRETLAAGLLLASRWQEFDLICDPMCGSGTLLIEAALLARDIPPGARRRFAFEELPSFQESKWRRLRREALESLARSPVTLVGGDLSPEALAAARNNAQAAGVGEDIRFVCGDACGLNFAGLEPGAGKGKALLVCNLPYGKRLGNSSEARELHGRFARHLKRGAADWDVVLLTTRPRWLLEAGLELKPLSFFSNGGLKVTALSGHVPENSPKKIP